MPADAPTSLAARAAATALPRGPLLVVLNPHAGAGATREAGDAVETVLRAAQRPYEFHHVSRHEPLAAFCRRLARRAAEQSGALVAAGGDGTINTAANAAREHGVALGILPLGTFNYFAREHAVPLDLADAARVLLTGVARPVTMGEVNGRLFFNNASFGLYTGLVQLRERAKRRFGRHRIVAAITAVAALLEGQPPFAIQTIVDDAPAMKYTSMVFVACNTLQLETLGLSAATCSKTGALAVVLLRPAHLGQRLRLLLRTALKQLDEDGRLESFCAMELEVRSHRRRIALVIDGEIVRLAPPLIFRTVPDALRLIVPAAPAAAS